MIASHLGLDLEVPAGAAPALPSYDVRRLPELAGSVEERRWEETWTAWAQLRAPDRPPLAAAPAMTPRRGARWAGHRRPRGRRPLRGL
jgi:hypothetical protein